MSLITIASTVPFLPNTPLLNTPLIWAKSCDSDYNVINTPTPVLGTKFCRLYHQITKTRKNENFSPNALNTPPPSFCETHNRQREECLV